MPENKTLHSRNEEIVTQFFDFVESIKAQIKKTIYTKSQKIKIAAFLYENKKLWKESAQQQQYLPYIKLNFSPELTVFCSRPNALKI